MQSKKEQYTDDATYVFSGEISAVIAYLQDILNEGFTHMDTEKWVEEEYSHGYAMCETKHYKVREETDGEYEKRCENHRKQKEAEKVKAEARRVAMEALTLEQRGALGIR
jgi:phosphosulfolactate synthase (CoM biosynthesis protein A)